MKTILILTFLASCVLAFDYCTIGCSNHIGCGQQNTSCPTTGSTKVKFNQAQINVIVDMHNKLRNDVAGGKIPGFDPAARMATMQWDSELAYLAGLNAHRCVYGHDRCRKTLKCPYAGQNIYASYSTVPFKATDMTTVIKGIQSWFDEYKDCNMGYINKYPSAPPKVIGHFTGMVGDNNYLVGCAAAAWRGGLLGYQYVLVCNYAMTNIIGRTIYNSAKNPTAQRCKIPKNPKYTNLCSTSEVYNIKL